MKNRNSDATCESIRGCRIVVNRRYEIQLPSMQNDALGAIVDVVNADGCRNGGEAMLLSEAVNLCGLELKQVTRTEVRAAHRLSPGVEIPRGLLS